MTEASGEFAARREALRGELRSLRMQSVVVTALPNLRYLSGFTGSNGALLLTPERELLFTDPRYQFQAPRQSDCEVKITKGALLPAVAAWVKRLKLSRLAFEAGRIGFLEFQTLKEQTSPSKLQPLGDVIERLRQIKSQSEIQAIRRSVMVNSAALDRALRAFKPSATEADLAAEIDFRMRRGGAEGTAFETIVASGERTALPHAQPTEQRISNHQLLLVDMGARVAGYCSDMTRTFSVGKLNAGARRMYDAVLEAQLAAIDAVKPGVKCSKVDGTAREVLRKHRLESAFIHSTGHGLGLEIHEGPRIGRKESTALQPGMVITIEPGVYVEGSGGVRIEDTVVVTANGCEVLTPTTKELRSL